MRILRARYRVLMRQTPEIAGRQWMLRAGAPLCQIMWRCTEPSVPCWLTVFFRWFKQPPDCGQAASEASTYTGRKHLTESTIHDRRSLDALSARHIQTLRDEFGPVTDRFRLRF